MQLEAITSLETKSIKLKSALSKQENRILRMMCQGLRQKEIGIALYISSKTVNVHMHTIRQRMKAHGVKFVLRLAEA